MALAVAIRSKVVADLLGGMLLFLIGLAFINRRLLGLGLDQPRTPAIDAMLPALVATTAFVGYAAALSTVHDSIFQRQLTAYSHVVHQANVAGAQADAAGAAALRAKRHLRHPTSTRQFQMFISRLSKIVAQSKAHHSSTDPAALILALKLLVSDAPGRKEVEKALTRFAAAIRAEVAAFRREATLRPPAANALPAWFGRLGSFFPLAAQILVGLIVALAFARRRLASAAEAQLRAAMWFAMLGVIAAGVGSLPDLHRGLQAFLLGYVVAGCAGALATTQLLMSGMVELHSAPSMTEPRSDQSEPADVATAPSHAEGSSST